MLLWLSKMPIKRLLMFLMLKFVSRKVLLFLELFLSWLAKAVYLTKALRSLLPLAFPPQKLRSPCVSSNIYTERLFVADCIFLARQTNPIHLSGQWSSPEGRYYVDDDDDSDDSDDDRVDRQLVRMGYRFLVRGCKGL